MECIAAGNGSCARAKSCGSRVNLHTPGPRPRRTPRAVRFRRRLAQRRADVRVLPAFGGRGQCAALRRPPPGPTKIRHCTRSGRRIRRIDPLSSGGRLSAVPAGGRGFNPGSEGRTPEPSRPQRWFATNDARGQPGFARPRLDTPRCNREPASLTVGTYLQRAPEPIGSSQARLRCHRAVSEGASRALRVGDTARYAICVRHLSYHANPRHQVPDAPREHRPGANLRDRLLGVGRRPR